MIQALVSVDLGVALVPTMALRSNDTAVVQLEDIELPSREISVVFRAVIQTL